MTYMALAQLPLLGFNGFLHDKTAYTATLYMSAKLFATQHATFALQYLRSSLTVPIHFERRMRLDSNRLDMLPVLDRRIKIICWSIYAVQTLLAFLVIPFTFIFRDETEDSLGNKITQVKLSMVRMDLNIASAVNVLTITMTLVALWRIKRWIKKELAEPHGRKWLCRRDGLFLIFLVLVCILFAVETFNGEQDFTSEEDKPDTIEDETKWELRNVWLTLFTVTSSLATMFILIFMIKMSRAVWSELPVEEMSRKTTMMDREVAAGWFDKTRLDLAHKFVSYTHNIPDTDERRQSLRSDRTSLLGDSDGDELSLSLIEPGSLNSPQHQLV